MPFSPYEFKESAPPFDPQLLTEEFTPLVEAWKATLPTPNSEPVKTTQTETQGLFAKFLKKLRLRTEPPIAIDRPPTQQEISYQAMVEYAMGATEIAKQFGCANPVLEYLQALAFDANWQKTASDFQIEVTMNNVRKADANKTVTGITNEAQQQIKKTLTFGYLLTKARQDAEIHYQTAEFKHELAQVLKLADEIKGAELAWDLEGVLISGSIEFMGKKSIGAVQAGVHIIRPGANEILAAMTDPKNSNGNAIWTAVAGAYMTFNNYGEQMIKNSGLKVPPNMEIFYRKQTADKLFEDERIITYFDEHPWKVAGDTWDFCKAGQLKIPSLFPGKKPIDLLIDDNADHHNLLARTFDIFESKQYLKAPRFHLADEASLRRHHLDRGLFEVVNMLHDRFK